MSDCNRCLWATRNGSCASWDCRFVDQREAYEAYNREKADANKWIPCSESLPSDSDYYLVTDAYGDVSVIWFAHEKDYYGKSEWRETEDEILAWMPLPEPWKGEEE